MQPESSDTPPPYHGSPIPTSTDNPKPSFPPRPSPHSIHSLDDPLFVPSITRGNQIISHDPLLNSSPTYLLRYLRKLSNAPLNISVHVIGIPAIVGGHKQIADTIDFRVPIEPRKGLGRECRPVLYVAGDWELAHRGEKGWYASAEGDERVTGGTRMGSYVSLADSERQAERGTRSAPRRALDPKLRETLKAERNTRVGAGAPGIIHPASLCELDATSSAPPLLHDSHFFDSEEIHSMRSSSTPGPSSQRALCDGVETAVEEYCSKSSLLKELVMERQCYGWHFDNLIQAIRTSLASENYSGTFTINVEIDQSHVVVRPNNRFSKMFSLHPFFHFCLFICGVYPLLCLFELFFAGARFDQFRTDTPLTRWRLLPSAPNSVHHTTASAKELASSLSSRKTPKVAETPAGDWVYLEGELEGEWLRKWQEAIAGAVRSRVKGGVVIAQKDEKIIRGTLRGYDDEEEEKDGKDGEEV